MNYDRILESLAGETVTVYDSEGNFSAKLDSWTSPGGIRAWLVGGLDGDIGGDGPWVIFGSDSVEEISISAHRTIIRLNK